MPRQWGLHPLSLSVPKPMIKMSAPVFRAPAPLGVARRCHLGRSLADCAALPSGFDVALLQYVAFLFSTVRKQFRQSPILEGIRAASARASSSIVGNRARPVRGRSFIEWWQCWPIFINPRQRNFGHRSVPRLGPNLATRRLASYHSTQKATTHRFIQDPSHRTQNLASSFQRNIASTSHDP